MSCKVIVCFVVLEQYLFYFTTLRRESNFDVFVFKNHILRYTSSRRCKITRCGPARVTGSPTTFFDNVLNHAHI